VRALLQGDEAAVEAQDGPTQVAGSGVAADAPQAKSQRTRQALNPPSSEVRLAVWVVCQHCSELQCACLGPQCARVCVDPPDLRHTESHTAGCLRLCKCAVKVMCSHVLINSGLWCVLPGMTEAAVACA